MRKTSLLALLLMPLGLLTACKTVGPDFAAPASPPPRVGYASDGAGHAVLGEGPQPLWWTAFASPQLDALVDTALAHNHSLAASMATLERSRDHIRAISGRSKPQVDAKGRAEYEQFNLSSFGLNSGLGSFGNPNFDLYTLGAGVSYDLDLFGKNRRMLEQAEAEAEAQQRQTEAAHLLIAGRVTLQVLAIAALNDRIKTEQALLTEDERNVALTQARQRAGVGTLVEVLSAQGQGAADRTNLPLLQQQLAEARSMLAVLTGVSPAELGPTSFSLDQLTLPVNVPVSLPSELIHKRPDIREAEARLHAATAAIGVATARLYPDINIGATLTQTTSAPQKLFNSSSTGFDIFAGIMAPIFDGGTRKAEKRGAVAAARATAETYQQVVLEAFGQVSTLLSALGNDQDALMAQSRSAEIADRSLYLSRRSFQVGNSGILQVLDASRAYQKAKLALLEARSRQYLNVARLVMATAGGWTGSGNPDAMAANSVGP
jgi:NodT family efflux transporter outer membrane factor (OMF) lipoprotein